MITAFPIKVLSMFSYLPSTSESFVVFSSKSLEYKEMKKKEQSNVEERED